MSTIEERVTNLENTMADVQATLAQVAQLQLANTQQLNQLTSDVAANTQQLNKLTTDVTAMDQWVKNFAFESQRLFTRIGGIAEKNEAAVDSLHQSVIRLTNNAEADRAESRERLNRMDSMISRMDTLIAYLMRREGNE